MTQHPDYPVCLRLDGRPVLVVGGGDVADGRVEGLLRAGAAVTVVSPTLTSTLATMEKRGTIGHTCRGVDESDLDGMALVLVCTDDSQANAQVAAWARARGIPVNVADDPPNCDFTLPSVFRRGDITITVSTGGKSPGYAANLRRRLEQSIDDADGEALALIAEMRARVKRDFTDPNLRFAAINQLVSLDLADVIRTRGLDEAKRIANQSVSQWQ